MEETFHSVYPMHTAPGLVLSEKVETTEADRELAREVKTVAMKGELDEAAKKILAQP